MRIALTGNEHKVSVTDLPFCVIRYDKHSADWLAALASPLSGCTIGHTCGVRVHWTHLRCEGSEGSEGSKGSECGGGALRAQIIKKAGPRPPSFRP